MQVKYGNFPFNANDASLVSTRNVMRSDAGLVIGYKETWIIMFRLRGDSQSDLTTEVNSFYAAFNENGKDLVLLDNNGNNSAFVIDSSDTFGGTQVVKTEFNLREAQYSTFLDGMVELEAEYITNSTAAAQSQYQETFTVTGNGGPKIVIVETAQGLPIKQQTRQRTMVRATQSGFSVGRGFRPPANQAYFPNYLINEEDSVSESLSFEGGQRVWRTEWNYQYQHNQFFAQTPIG